ncbi:MAG: hypothetical protein IKN53_03885 [Oscillibacter sp.]|nr:hypothetical protein [Oscillibacter sp.]
MCRALRDRAGAAGEERILLARVLDKAEQASRRDVPAATDFLAPHLLASAQELLRLAGIAETAYRAAGGYDGAQRRILQFLPEWAADAEPPIRCLRATYRAGETLTHRDVLGSLMGLGVVREKLGDILVSDQSTDVLVLESVAPYLLQNWTSSGRVSVKVAEVPLAHIHVPVQAFREIRTTLASLRLDAVCAAGMHVSRGRAAELIAAGRVFCNDRPCTRGDHTLCAKDTLSVRGFGKMELTEVGDLTRKGRVAVLIRKYE